jgi:lipopolysaccharide/colanic/teichoic acid biosynthesis glycosyltransferase/glycosyltransferase involved in cell wall biosynthesis
MNYNYKVLQVTAADVTVKKLLMPLIDRLIAEGYQVHVACTEGDYVPGLRTQGYTIHNIGIQRKINPISNLKSLWNLYRLMKRERFDIVHVHTPVAAALGRVAAWMAGTPVIIYTAHGFYFHDNMSAWVRRLIIWAEKFLCRTTHLVFTQSHEDAVNAVREGICSDDRVICIGNGIDIRCFTNQSNRTRTNLGLSPEDKVVGFVGRLVGEKGILELIEAMRPVVKTIPEAKLLIVGDRLDSDRDKKTKQVIANLLADDDLASHILFTGFIDEVPKAMAALDLFVLPSHREGMPRTIIEAMASGKPVIATNIRGCREEVVPGVTGLLVPVKDPAALAIAIISLLSDPRLARQMGDEGRRRAYEFFDERMMLDKQIRAYEEIACERLAGNASKEKIAHPKRVQLGLKRVIDIVLSSLSLTVLCIPFMVIAALIKIDSRGPVFFLQERTGKNGRVFSVFKFRTMIVGAVNHGLGFNIAKDDPRITRIGNLLRNWGIDELPQLINVLKGEMSIIGPRPALCYQTERYDAFQRQRLLFKPGIGSLAVVCGRNLLSWKERIKLDVAYINNWSLWWDIKIIFQTFWAVLVTRKGIYGSEGKNDDFMDATSDIEKPDLNRQIKVGKPDQVTVPDKG